MKKSRQTQKKIKGGSQDELKIQSLKINTRDKIQQCSNSFISSTTQKERTYADLTSKSSAVDESQVPQSFLKLPGSSLQSDQNLDKIYYSEKQKLFNLMKDKRVQRKIFCSMQSNCDYFLQTLPNQIAKKNTKLQDSATITYSDLEVDQYYDQKGNFIKGKKLNGKLHGYARIQYPDGSNFQGVFMFGVRQFGQFTFSNGNKYKGQFHLYNFQGQGTFTFYNNKVIKGFWQQSRPKANSGMQVYYPNGDVYFGPLNHQYRKHGYGSIIFKNRYQFKGLFYHGQMLGQGVYLNNQNQKKSGYWINGFYKGSILTQQIRQQIEQAKKRLNDNSQKLFSEKSYNSNSYQIEDHIEKQSLQKQFNNKKNNQETQEFNIKQPQNQNDFLSQLLAL